MLLQYFSYSSAWYHFAEKFEEAEEKFKQALSLREKHLGPTHVEVAQTVHNLALLYRNTKRMSEAEPLYTRCREIWELAAGGQPIQNPNVAVSAKVFIKMVENFPLSLNFQPLSNHRIRA